MADRPSVEAVKLAKRTPLYRERRAGLARVAPVDVWHEASEHLVLFSLVPDGHFETFLAFKVDVGAGTVVSAGVLALDAADGAWRVQNVAP